MEYEAVNTDLPEDADLNEVRDYLTGMADEADGQSPTEKALIREKAINRLNAVKAINAPAKIVDTFLEESEREAKKDNAFEEDESDLPDDPDALRAIGGDILTAEDQLALLRNRLDDAAYAGDKTAGELISCALHSRNLERPVNMGLYGESGGGKTWRMRRIFQFHPDDVVHDLTAMSERSLAYSDFPTEHRYVFISESSALFRDGVGATIIRGLAWGEGIRYETVEKTKDGLQARRIEKPGPTGLLTTTTKDFEEQIDTRLLTLELDTSTEKIREVLQELGKVDAGEKTMEPDTRDFRAASRWLELEGRREILVPFAKRLAQLFPAKATRLNRDFMQVSSVLKTHAFMHQLNRELDEQGRVVADRRDYEAAYRLLNDLLTISLGEDVTDTVRETVEMVETLNREDHGVGVSHQQLADALDVHRTTACKRAQSAMKGGYIADQEWREGKRARLVVVNEVPDEDGDGVLPTPEELFADGGAS